MFWIIGIIGNLSNYIIDYDQIEKYQLYIFVWNVCLFFVFFRLDCKFNIKDLNEDISINLVDIKPSTSAKPCNDVDIYFLDLITTSTDLQLHLRFDFLSFVCFPFLLFVLYVIKYDTSFKFWNSVKIKKSLYHFRWPWLPFQSNLSLICWQP